MGVKAEPVLPSSGSFAASCLEMGRIALPGNGEGSSLFSRGWEGRGVIPQLLVSSVPVLPKGRGPIFHGVGSLLLQAGEVGECPIPDGA